VYPITEAIAEEFQSANAGGARVTVGVSGTGGGFKKFCRGELDITNASRPIQQLEMDDCAKAGIRYYELPVAFDALTVVVNPANPLAEVSVDQLKRMWEPAAQGQILRWNQVDPAWADAPLALYGAGSDSGTFDYFTEAVVGEAKSSRGDFTASEDDNTLVQGVAQDINAIGYFGYAYFTENQDKLKALAIAPQAGATAVRPTRESVIGGSYQPLSRPLFIYVSEKAYARPEVKGFIDFYFANAARLADETGYIPLPDAAYGTIKQHLADGKFGTVFAGHSATGVTVESLLEREASL
jgi:phosphate transport system substrate-binding protein